MSLLCAYWQIILCREGHKVLETNLLAFFHFSQVFACFQERSKNCCANFFFLVSLEFPKLYRNIISSELFRNGTIELLEWSKKRWNNLQNRKYRKETILRIGKFLCEQIFLIEFFYSLSLHCCCFRCWKWRKAHGDFAFYPTEWA